MIRKITLAAAGLMFAASAVLAEGGPHEGAIKARQGMMQIYAHNLGILGAMAKGEAEYNAEAATIAAANIVTMTGLGAGSMWPQGSDNASVENTRALPAIWETFPAIVDKGQALSDAALELASAAGSGLESLTGAIGPVGKACGSCHEDYRQSDN